MHAEYRLVSQKRRFDRTTRHCSTMFIDVYRRQGAGTARAPPTPKIWEKIF